MPGAVLWPIFRNCGWWWWVQNNLCTSDISSASVRVDCVHCQQYYTRIHHHDQVSHLHTLCRQQLQWTALAQIHFYIFNTKCLQRFTTPQNYDPLIRDESWSEWIKYNLNIMNSTTLSWTSDNVFQCSTLSVGAYYSYSSLGGRIEYSEETCRLWQKHES